MKIMKPKDVREVLRISRSTLRRLRKEGKIKAVRFPNGRYTVKRILTIRISGRERKEKTKSFLYDLVHFKNMLIILIRRYRLIYKKNLLNQSILYGLLSSRGYSGKYTQEFEETLKNIEKDEDLCRLLKALKAQKQKIENPHFVQSLIRQLVKDFRSFFKAFEKFKQDPSKFKGMPKPPKPKKLNLLMNFSAEGNANTFKKEGNFLVLKLRGGEYLKVKLPEEFPHRISSVRVKLYGHDLYVDVVYEQEIKEIEPKGEYRAGIDIGLDELLAVVSENPELKSFIVSGREIKAFNQWFNKEKAKLQSEIDCLKNKLRNGKASGELREKLKELEVKLMVLSAHRKRWMDTQMHRIARKVVDILYETGHKVIYIGRKAIEIKNGINLGKVNNQNFVFIPFKRLIELIKYKAEELGMEVIDDINESYTSKTSPLADIFEVQKLGEEKRKLEDKKVLERITAKIKDLRNGERKGNLFKDKILNKVLHADLVGALNILRVGAKLPKLGFYKNLKVFFVKLCNPVRLKLMDLFFKVTPESLLWIGGSNSGLSPRTVKSNHLTTFCF